MCFLLFSFVSLPYFFAQTATLVFTCGSTFPEEFLLV